LFYLITDLTLLVSAVKAKSCNHRWRTKWRTKMSILAAAGTRIVRWLGRPETFYQTHVIHYTTYCPNRPRTHKHELRTRRHYRLLLCKSKFDDSNFITRLLFKDCY